MTHGYMLAGSGSNVYVQNLCRALVRGGHDVHLLCQEEEPLDYEFVDEHASVDGAGIEKLGVRRRRIPGGAWCTTRGWAACCRSTSTTTTPDGG
jgi:hypothetical protein